MDSTSERVHGMPLPAERSTVFSLGMLTWQLWVLVIVPLCAQISTYLPADGLHAAHATYCTQLAADWEAVMLLVDCELGAEPIGV